MRQQNSKDLTTLLNNITEIWNKRIPPSVVSEKETMREDETFKVFFDELDRMFGELYTPSVSENGDVMNEKVKTIKMKMQEFIEPCQSDFMQNGLYLDVNELFNYLAVHSNKKHLYCSHFTSNEDYINTLSEKYGDDAQHISFVDILIGWECKTCGKFDNDHVSCGHYMKNQEYSCATCGLTSSKHVACSMFEKSNENPNECINCGISRNVHIKKHNMSCCGTNFVNDGSDHCLRCLYGVLEHTYKPHYFEMDDDTRETFGLLVLQFLINSTPSLHNINVYNQFSNLVCVPNYTEILSKSLTYMNHLNRL